MEHAAKLIGVVSQVEGIFHGCGEVKDMMRARIRSLQSVLDVPCLDAMFAVELEGLKSILGKIEDLHLKYTACEEDGKATRVLKKTNRGLDHQPIREDLAKFDAEVTRLFGVITTMRALKSQSDDRPAPPKYRQEGMVAKERLVNLWQSRLENPPVHGAPMSIVGMGGMGKTTVAKALCGKYETQQWRTCVVMFDLRQSSTKEIESLQRGTLKELEPNLNVEGWTMDQMQAKLAALVRAPGESAGNPKDSSDAPSSIFLVLDNIHSTRDAINFMGELAQWHVGEHCRVLLTGRDREILSRICGEGNTYDVDALESQEAEQLLQQSSSLPASELQTEDERQLVRRAMGHLAFCKHSATRPHYHPLATTVLGGALRGRSFAEKQRRLESFIRNHHEADREHEVEQCLITSFALLDGNHRRLFLDVALCLPSTVTRRFDVAEWCSWNDNSSRLSTVDNQLESLEQACMIKCEPVSLEQLHSIPCLKSPADRRGVVIMHDLLRALAENLVSKPSLRKRRILHAIRSVDDGNDDEEDLPSEWLNSVNCEVDNVRVVLMKSKAVDLDDVAHLTSNRNISVVHVIQCTKLRHLPRIESALLRSVDLSDSTSLSSVPQSWGGNNLRFMSLRGCASLAGLPFDHFELPSLRVLDLSGCKSLKDIPALNMPKLRMLNLSFCEGLVELPNLGGLQALEELYMRCCTSLRVLDNSIGALLKLRVLNINSCTSLPRLPVELRKCTEMVLLELGMCALGHESLQTVFTLSKLRFLLMGNCRFDDSGLEGIQGIADLEYLVVSWTTNLRSLPKGMEMLTSLKVLDIWNATDLQIGREVAGILAGLPKLAFICDWKPTIHAREADLLLFQPRLKNTVHWTRQKLAPAFYEAAICGHAGQASYGASIVSALDICSRYGRDPMPREELDAATFNLLAWIDTDENRRVFLDNGGAQLLAETTMNAASGRFARTHSAIALHNVSISYPREVFDALDLDAWLRENHPPGSGKVHDHNLCKMVVGSCCDGDSRLTTKTAGKTLAEWAAAGSQTESLCMECVQALVR